MSANKVMMADDNKQRWYLFSMMAFWLLIVASSLFWNLLTTQNGMERTVLNIGRSFFKEIETTRLWNARHGGVYVPITTKTKPNPYLKGPNRDLTTTNGMALTKINPAYMTRQIADIARSESNIQYHITSLKPIRPANIADNWEANVLHGFENGKKESFQFIKKENVFRYMAPLLVKNACLKCHAKQGYQIGDVRGGISVTIPAPVYLAVAQKTKNSLIVIHVVALLFGLLLIYLVNRYRDLQERKMKKKNYELEREIAVRKAAELENKRLEGVLRQVHKIEAIGTMAGGVAHNFNNILSGIIGYSEMAYDEAGQNTQGRLYITEVLSAANRAKTLVKNIVAFSDQAVSVKGGIAPEAVMTRVLDDLKERLPANIRLEENISRKVQGILIAPLDLFWIIENFFDNALEAMVSEGGVLRVTLENVELNSTDLQSNLQVTPGRFARLIILDTGCGIAETDLERVFDPFFTTKEIGYGGGIGLSVVMGIVRRYGGMVTVKSNHGQGSIFTVLLPVDG